MLLALLPGIAVAEGPPADYKPTAEYVNLVNTVMSNATVKKGLDFIKAGQAQIVKDDIELTEIESPPFGEKVRGVEFGKRLAAAGLKDVKTDAAGNVYALRKGTGKGPTLLVAAHLDTVFPAGTDVKVKEKDGKLYAPGIGDDGIALGSLLTIVRAFDATGIKTVGDIIFCGDVGEEGLGDLRGMKQIFPDHPEIDGFISIEPGSSGVTYLATGSHRFEVTFKGPGGHSFGAFGIPSPIHAMGRAIAKIGEIQVPKSPKTTFTVGVVSGGTSVNSIAYEAIMQVDMRSNDEVEVIKTEQLFRKAVYDGVFEENYRWGSDKITVDIKMVGDRGAGGQDPYAPIVQIDFAAQQAVGLPNVKLGEGSSTDSNYPIQMGIPAVTTVGGGVKGAGGHSLNEWVDPTDAYRTAQHTFLSILSLVGIEGVTKPALAERGTK
jgi:acetylornithine deacetylase/succinyl-diaminopimelate desuccinylase-like protein